MADPLSSALMGNYNAANTALNMTPQEQALYQLHLSNLWGSGGVDNPDGSRSSLYQVGFDQGGQTYNVPSVYDGQIISPDAAVARADQTGLSQFPSYPDAATAEARYQQMHGYMGKDTGAYMDVRRNPLPGPMDPSLPQNQALVKALMGIK